MRLEDEPWMWGGRARALLDRRCEVQVDRASSLNLVYHTRHGNITSIFFSLQDQSLHNPSKQQWNNSVFPLCGLGGRWSDCSLQEALCCWALCSVKVETVFSFTVKFNFHHLPSRFFEHLYWVILQVESSHGSTWCCKCISKCIKKKNQITKDINVTTVIYKKHAAAIMT